MTYGLIFSAGKETRFDNNIPKCFSTFKGQTFLDINIRNLNECCDKVLIVTSNENERFFFDYEHISIESGLGCGDAVMKALSYLKLNSNDFCYIHWGDCIFDGVKNMKEFYTLNNQENVIIPCVYETNPYVSIFENENNKIEVYFSKYNEVKPAGFHDLGVFFGRASYILDYLFKFRDKIYYNGRYSHKHGNEMQFLDVFNETDIKGKLMIANCKSISFNTKEELYNIKCYE